MSKVFLVSLFLLTACVAEQKSILPDTWPGLDMYCEVQRMPTPCKDEDGNLLYEMKP